MGNCDTTWKLISLWRIRTYTLDYSLRKIERKYVLMLLHNTICVGMHTNAGNFKHLFLLKYRTSISIAEYLYSTLRCLPYTKLT